MASKKDTSGNPIPLSETEAKELFFAVKNAVFLACYRRFDKDVLDWLCDTSGDLITRRVKRMIAGQAKYGGNFLKDVNHLAELQLELDDAINYLYGATNNPYPSNGRSQRTKTPIALRKPKDRQD